MLNTTYYVNVYYVYSFFILKCTGFIMFTSLRSLKAFLELQKMLLNTPLSAIGQTIRQLRPKHVSLVELMLLCRDGLKFWWHLLPLLLFQTCMHFFIACNIKLRYLEQLFVNRGQTRDETVYKFHIMIIVTKMITQEKDKPVWNKITMMTKWRQNFHFGVNCLFKASIVSKPE